MIIDKLAPPFAVLSIWFSAVLAMPFMPGLGAKVDVLLPSENLLQNLPRDVTIVNVSPRRVTLFSDRSGLALAIYMAGGGLVLPSAGNGCLDFRNLK